MASRSIENETDHHNHFHLIMNQFSCEHPTTRAEGVVSFQQYLVSRLADSTPEECDQLFQKTYTHLLNLLRDPSESVREKAISCIKYFYIEFLPKNDYYLTYLVPLIGERIGSGDEIEQSEEIRLALLRLLVDLLATYSNDKIRQFAGDIIRIVTEALNDQYDMVIQICFKIIDGLSVMCPIEVKTMDRKLIQSLLPTVCHRFYRIRMQAVHTIGEMVMATGSECMELIADAVRARVNDTVGAVRKMVAQVAGRWLQEHPNRYSHFHIFIPILLPILSDESAENRIESNFLWSLVGKQYYEENEEELKDELNYYSQELELYPLKVERPSFGCRKMVQRYISLMVQSVCADLVCDLPKTRFYCTQLLIHLVRHCGEGIVHYLPKIFLGMFSAIHDDNKTVRVNILESGQLIGFFVSSHEWWSLILPFIDENCNSGHLAILAALIKGFPGPMPSNVLIDIASTLATSRMCQTRNVNCTFHIESTAGTLSGLQVGKRVEMLNCTKALQSQYHSNVDAIKFSESIFNIIVSLISMKDTMNVYDMNLLLDLKRVVHIDDLWSIHSDQLLNRINKDPKSWHEDSAECFIFYTILTESRGVLWKNFEKIVFILMRALDVQVPAKCRLRTFMGFAESLELNQTCLEEATEDIKEFLPMLIIECFAPALIWKAGRSEELLRTSATNCIEIVLALGQSAEIFKTDQQMFEIFETLIALMQTLLTDASSITRKLALANLVHIKNKLVEKKKWTESDLIKLYPAILNVLDDPVYNVAFNAVNATKYILEDLPSTFCEPVHSAHHEFIVNGLFVHLDNENETWAATILEILKDFAKVNFKMMCDKAEKQIAFVRNQEACKELMEYINKS